MSVTAPSPTRLPHPEGGDPGPPLPRFTDARRARRGTRGVGASLRSPSPWASSWFWLLQVVILAASLVRLSIVVGLDLGAATAGVEYSTILVFLPLTTLGALAFGYRGAAASCCWTVVLALPQLTDALSQHAGQVAVIEIVQLAVLSAVSVTTGVVVDNERRRRGDAELHLDEATRTGDAYRDLFDSNQSPILVVDRDGTVVQANSTAADAFGAAVGRSDDSHGPTGALSGRPRLIDVVGPDAAGELLGDLLAVGTSDARDGRGQRRIGQPPEASTPAVVEVPVHGVPTLFRPTTGWVCDVGDQPSLQIVFEDVTEERRRRLMLESFATHVVLGQEEERKRISQELHDGPLQSLILLCRQLDRLAPDRSKSAEFSARDEVRTNVGQIIDELRSIARGLRPSALDDLGLVASLGQLLSEVERHGDVATSLVVSGSECRPPSLVELTIFRIAQEAISNVQRHAAASRLTVALDFADDGLHVRIDDDGVGFDPRAARPPEASSLGMAGMAERARLIGATLEVHSDPGSGTSMRVSVPGAILQPDPPVANESS